MCITPQHVLIRGYQSAYVRGDEGTGPYTTPPFSAGRAFSPAAVRPSVRLPRGWLGWIGFWMARWMRSFSTYESRAKVKSQPRNNGETDVNQVNLMSQQRREGERGACISIHACIKRVDATHTRDANESCIYVHDALPKGQQNRVIIGVQATV